MPIDQIYLVHVLVFHEFLLKSIVFTSCKLFFSRIHSSEMIFAGGLVKMFYLSQQLIEKRSYKLCKNYFSSTIVQNMNSGGLLEKQKELMARGLPKQKPLPGVKQILVVASGKGGVGKSTTAVNLSIALKLLAPDKSVGLLDADVFGPSIPLMMNLRDSPLLNSKNLIEPLVNYGIKCMSMGFLIDEKSPVVWRGLMVMGAINKLLYQVSWGPLDYLIIDTPPGTGDVHLSLVQNLPITGMLLITSPQKAAVDVARRGASMYNKVNVPLVGIVCNMANVTCPRCEYEIPLYEDESEILAKELGINVLCRIPLDNNISRCSDSGKPVILNDQDSPSSLAYKKVAQSVLNYMENSSVKLN